MIIEIEEVLENELPLKEAGLSPRESLTIESVLESLNTIVEADTLDDIEITDKGEMLKESGLGVPAAANEQTLNAVRETFRIVYKYLQAYYKHKNIDKEHLRERISTVMVLVGEAARKLEKFHKLFQDRIPKLPEYKQLQSFYRQQIAHETYKEFTEPLTEDEKWEQEIEEFLTSEHVEEQEGVHVLNDVEVVKNDHLYELFYMKNEAGHHFYTSELARSLKLACEFGKYAEHYFGDDPLLQIRNWEDKSLQVLAKKILKASRAALENYFRQALKYKEVPIVSALQKAIFALMMAANPKNLIRQFSVKGCGLYFQDFHNFLKETIASSEYRRFLYSPPTTTPFFVDVMSLIHSLTWNFISLGPGRNELKNVLNEMTKRFDALKSKTLSEFLTLSQSAIAEVLSKHPNGPLFKALDLIREEDETRSFDPFALNMLAGPEVTLKMGDKEINLLRMPSPTIQEFIDQAIVNDLFKDYLHAATLHKNSFYLLMFNLQDKTSWKEHARCKVLEEMARSAEFHDVFTVVTLAKDTEFYTQTGVYHDLSNASDFIDQFNEHLGDETTGYFFPPHLKKELFQGFISTLLQTVHEAFFSSKKELKLNERLDFIELVYHFIELKIVELENPTYFTLTSKDGLDITGTSAVGLLALISALQDKKWKEEEFSLINLILFGQTLLNRERAVHKERIDRLIDMVKVLENHRGQISKFEKLFKPEVLAAEISFPVYREDE